MKLFSIIVFALFFLKAPAQSLDLKTLIKFQTEAFSELNKTFLENKWRFLITQKGTDSTYSAVSWGLQSSIYLPPEEILWLLYKPEISPKGNIIMYTFSGDSNYLNFVSQLTTDSTIIKKTSTEITDEGFKEIYNNFRTTDIIEIEYKNDPYKRNNKIYQIKIAAFVDYFKL